MNIIETKNEDGFMERWAIMDEDEPEEAREVGIYVGVPDLSGLDWEGLHRRIHNKLHEQGIFTLEDAIQRDAAVVSIAKFELVRHIIKEYKS
jgi:hypothetical protein